MRPFVLLAFLATSCSVLPVGIGEPAPTSNYYVYRQSTTAERDLAPVMSGIAPLNLFKKASVGVEQGLLGFTAPQLALIREACAYINGVFGEDVLYYAKQDPDVKISPYESACCLGEASTWAENNRLRALVEIKTVQSPAQFYTTVVHEFGHVFGLDHTDATGSVMSATSEDPPVSNFNEVEVKTLQYLRRRK